MFSLFFGWLSRAAKRILDFVKANHIEFSSEPYSIDFVASFPYFASLKHFLFKEFLLDLPKFYNKTLLI